MASSFLRLGVLAAFLSLFSGVVAMAAPAITRQPGLVVVTSGQSATFSVEATGDGALSYQWRRLGVPLNGKTAATMTLGGVTMAEAGFYDVVVTEGGVSVVSDGARLMVAPVGGYPNRMRLDTSFAPALEAETAVVSALGVASDGRVYVGGRFTTIGGVRRPGLARFNADLSVDTGFKATAFSRVDRLSVGPSGSVVVWGWMARSGGGFGRGFCRLLSDGSVDPGFVVPGELVAESASMYGLKHQNDGRLLVWGAFTGIAGLENCSLLRLNANGSLDTSFAPVAGAGVVGPVEVVAGGKVLIGGRFTSIGGTACNSLVRLNANGTLDPTFVNSLGPLEVMAMTTNASGRICLSVAYPQAPEPVFMLRKLLPDGASDGSFTPTTDWGGGTSHLAVLSDGRLAEARDSSMGSPSFRVLLPTGSVDPAFVFPETGQDNEVNMALAPDGGLIIAGFSAGAGSALKGGLAKYAANGALSHRAADGLRDLGWTTACVNLEGGKLLVGGSFTHVNGERRPYLVRLAQGGTLDAAFDARSAVSAPVTSLAVQGDGRIVATGRWVGKIARLQANGTLDQSFQVGAGFTGVSNQGPKVALLPDGRIVVADGGAYAGASHPALALLFPNGTADAAFALPALSSGNIWDLAVGSNRSISIVGSIGLVSNWNWTWPYVATFSDTGSLLFPTQNAGLMGGTAMSVCFDSMGRMVCGSRFSISAPVGGSSSLQRFDTAGNVLPNAGANLPFHGGVYSTLPQADGGILVCGGYAANDDRSKSAFARLDGAGGLDGRFEVPLIECSPYTSLLFADDGALIVSNTTAAAGAVSCTGLVRLVPDRVAQPSIVAQPGDVQVANGAKATLRVEADGAETYQWYLGDAGDVSSPFAGATASELLTPALSAWRRYWVRVTNEAGSVDSRTALVRVLGGTMTYADWLAQDALSAGQRGPLASPADDGVANLVKFALGVPPLACASAHLPVGERSQAAGQPAALALLFSRNVGAVGVRLALEISPDLVSWSEAPSAVDDLGQNPDGTVLVRLRETTPPLVSRRFARLKAELVSP